MAAAGAAVKLKRLRQRFGISAPKLAIRTHVAWYWRAVAVVVLLSISLALAEWVYDAGRSIAGFDSRTSSQALADLKARVAELESELAVVRGVASAADSNLKIERVAQQQMGQQVRALESENAALKQDLAFFEGLLPDSIGGEQGVRSGRSSSGVRSGKSARMAESNSSSVTEEFLCRVSAALLRRERGLVGPAFLIEPFRRVNDELGFCLTVTAVLSETTRGGE